jgi:hypothetical protein
MNARIRGLYEWICSVVLAAVIVFVVGTAIYVFGPIACYFAPRCSQWLW